MALSVIGAGFGRTGTLSLKLALEQIGVGRCYHMLEVFANPGHAAHWSEAASGAAVDWDALFEGYAATVDWPACHFWRQLTAHTPEARVILTLRDPDRWYESVLNTIYSAMQRGLPEDAPEAVQIQGQMARTIVLEQTFGGRFEDRPHAIDVYQRHSEAVKREIPSERLLVFEVADGWEPLCRFLDLPVPETEFPRVNTSDEFLERMGLASR